jgi:hypothetical protein
MLSVLRSIYIQKLIGIVKNGLAHVVFEIILRKRPIAMSAASGLSQSFTLVGEPLMRLALLMLMFASQAFGADDLEFFESKVRPLLATQCYSCHSSKATIVQGGLRLDSRETILRGGHSGPALVPGNSTTIWPRGFDRLAARSSPVPALIAFAETARMSAP